MNYQQTLEYLFNSLPVFEKDGASAYKPGLDRTIEFNNYLNRPDSTFQVIHIAGTNGKGSVSHILASILQNAGYRVGLFTSPHLRDFRERVKIDGQMIRERDVVDFVAKHKAKMEQLELSFFEMNVGIAFDHFRANDVEVAVVETGLGGRLDSTNIVHPILSIITNIGLDHTSLLGDSIELIAAEKAGIIKPRTVVVIGETDPYSSHIFIDKAVSMDAKIRFADQTLRCIETDDTKGVNTIRLERLCDQSRQTIELDLLGDYQKKNIVTVLTAIDVLNSDTKLNISRRATIDGAQNAARDTGLSGRWQILTHIPLTVCDTGHNEHGLKMVCRQIQRQTYQNLYMVVGFANDKDLNRILPLLPAKAHYIFTRAATNRALPATELAQLAAAAGLSGEVVETVAGAVAKAKELATDNDMIFIGGSTFVVAEI